MTATVDGILLGGTHAARPAATAVESGALYACTDHTIVYQSDGSAWGNWHDPTALTGGAGTLTLIEEKILGSAGAITFTGIAASYRHLRLVARLRSSVAGISTVVGLRVGNAALDTGNNYAYAYHRKGTTDDDAASEAASMVQRIQCPAASGTASFFGYAEWDILHYANTSFYRTIGFKGGEPVGSANEVGSGMGLWKNAANAIDTVGIVEVTAGANFEAGSAAWLYGIS